VKNAPNYLKYTRSTSRKLMTVLRWIDDDSNTDCTA